MSVSLDGQSACREHKDVYYRKNTVHVLVNTLALCLKTVRSKTG